MDSLRPVLIVDTEESIITLVSLCLEQFGHRTLSAHTAREALALARKGTEPALLIADTDLPDMDATELGAAVTQLYPETRVLFMSGSWTYIGSDGEQGAYPLPFLSKPFEIGALRRRIAELIGKDPPSHIAGH